jgi:preprotein translocase subunit SecA
VTIATNMAGRGTDIKLGGNAEMMARAEAGASDGPELSRPRLAKHRREVEARASKVRRRAASRHRHRAAREPAHRQPAARPVGRQGDPGASRFFLSLEDDLMRIFGPTAWGGMLQKLGLKDGEAIVHPWINKALEKAQKKVEARNFDTLKNLLKYDDV